MKKRDVLKIVFTLLFVGVIYYTVLVFLGPRFYRLQQKRMVERVMNSDPQALRLEGRRLFMMHDGKIGGVAISDLEIPSVLKSLKPSRISFNSGSVDIDFGDPFNPFGITVFEKDSQGYDPDSSSEKWIDGVWIFHDGQLIKWKANNPSQPTFVPQAAGQ